MIWSNAEKESLLKFHNKYKDEMSWELLRPHFKNRSAKALKTKLKELLQVEKMLKMDWDEEESKAAFIMYISGKKKSEIQDYLLGETGIKIPIPVIKQELDRVRARTETFFNNIYDTKKKYTLEMLQELVQWLDDGRKTKMPFS